MARHLTNRLWQSFLQLNLFVRPSSDAQTAPKERLATRIYICALFISLFAIIIVAALLVRTVEKTDYSPSYRKFHQLIQKYPNTLSCPCSNIGIAYNTFVTIHVRFHQVCSSPFVKQEWIDYISSKDNISFSSIDDYRVALSFVWQIIAGLCAASSRTWIDAANNFGTSRILTPMAITNEVVRTTVDAALNNHIAIARASLARDLLAIRRMTSGNQIVSGLQTNYYLRFPPTLEDVEARNSAKMSPRMFNDCSCLNIEGCPRSATFKDTNNHSSEIPGMIVDCLIIDGVLASTLECYYNQTCLSLLHPSFPANIQPLSKSLDNYFSENFTVQMLLNQIMVDQMITEIRFDVFYSQCNPAYCFYSYTRRFDVLFVVTTIIGIFGTVSMVLRLITPFITEGILRWKRGNSKHNNRTNERLSKENYLRIIWTHVQHLPNLIRETVVTLNLFESETMRTSTQIYRQRIFTRIFVILLILSLITAGLYIFLVEQNQVVTIEHPSLSTYEQLYNNHPDTLRCSCSQISVSYEVLLNVTFVLHQICQSNLVSPEWLKYLASFDPTLVSTSANTPYSHDFRQIGASYFQLLATFCSLVRITIEDAQRVFANTQFVNDRVIPRALFHRQTQAIIESFINRTQNEFVQIVHWIDIAFVSSQFFNGANVNVDVTITDDHQVSITSSILVIVSSVSDTSINFSGVCGCELEALKGCYIVPVLYTNESNLDYSPKFLFYRILKVGCSPLIGFSHSQIDWWYNATFFKYIQATYSMVIDFPSSLHITSLDASETTRFKDVNTIDLINEMMLETTTTNNTHFEQFYSACAPSSCTYTIIRRRNLIVLLFLLIAICSGLSKGLKILIPSIGKLIFFAIDQMKHRHVQQGQTTMTVRFKHLLSTAYHSIKTLNLFQTGEDDEASIHQQQIYTRIYFLLFMSFLGLILFYTAIIERTISKTYLSPSITEYEQLVELYSHDVTCPCTYVSITYGEFITELQVDAFHNACDDSQMRTILTEGAVLSPGMFYGTRNDFTSTWIPLIIGSFENLCALAKETVNNNIANFRSSTKFINQMITRSQFIRETNETLDRFEQEISIAFTRTLDLIRTIAQGNALMSLFSFNWHLLVDENSQRQNVSFLHAPVLHYDEQANLTCSCATRRTCAIPAKVNISNELTPLDGFVSGCTLLETLLLSSLSCLHSFTCINLVRWMVGGNYIFPGPFGKLDASSTRFSINDTIETLASQLFIESWTSNMSYERFFNSCLPSHCTFTYHYRFDVLELLTTFLSVFAGLSLGLRIAIPLLMKIIQKIRRHFRIAPIQ